MKLLFRERFDQHKGVYIDCGPKLQVAKCGIRHQRYNFYLAVHCTTVKKSKEAIFLLTLSVLFRFTAGELAGSTWSVARLFPIVLSGDTTPSVLASPGSFSSSRSSAIAAPSSARENVMDSSSLASQVAKLEREREREREVCIRNKTQCTPESESWQLRLSSLSSWCKGHR